MKRLTTALLSILSIFTCCADKQKAPRLPLTKISYRYGSQMIQYPSTDMTFFVEGDSTYAVVFDINTIKYSRYLINDTELMKRMKDIITEEKMYKYKGSYNNPNVLDGDSWSFHASFTDDVDDRHTHYEGISSGGSNSWPRGKGLKTIEDVMKKALTEAQFLYICDNRGKEIPDVPLDARMAQTDDVCNYIYFNRYEYNSSYRYRFYDLDTTESYLKVYKDFRPEELSGEIETRAQESFGLRLFEEKDGYVAYLIVEHGAIESISIDDLLKGQNKTTRFSTNQDFTDVVMTDGHVMGINKQGETVEITWE